MINKIWNIFCSWNTNRNTNTLNTLRNTNALEMRYQATIRKEILYENVAHIRHLWPKNTPYSENSF